MPIAFSENEAGRRENRRGLSWRVVVCDPPVMLPLLFLPKPKDIERRESIDWRGESWATAPDILTGGYFFVFSGFSSCSEFLLPPKREFVRLKIPPIVLDLLCPLSGAATVPSGKPATRANFAGTC
jgi:hypothetical protein